MASADVLALKSAALAVGELKALSKMSCPYGAVRTPDNTAFTSAEVRKFHQCREVRIELDGLHDLDICEWCVLAVQRLTETLRFQIIERVAQIDPPSPTWQCDGTESIELHMQTWGAQQ
jgi:hypothetical protein